MYIDVILPLAVPKCYTYIAPEALCAGIQQGMLVRVTLGRRFYNGIVLRLHDDAEEGINYKPVLGVLSNGPIVSGEQIELWQWIAK
ncbi:MAG: primosomal protein N', partial [Bacteroidales bacterium]|nr:primosomal protein N' [Bacteroidales bacterium]